MTRPRISYEGGGRVAAAMAGVVLACSGTGCGSRAGSERLDPADAAVTTFQSAGGDEPGDVEQPVGQLARRALRPRDGLRLGPQTHRRVRRPRGRQRARTSATCGSGTRRRANWNQRTPRGLRDRRCPYDRSGHAMVYDTGPQEDGHVRRLAAGRRLLSPRVSGSGTARRRRGPSARCTTGSRRRASARRWPGTARAIAPCCSAASTRRPAGCNDTWEWDARRRPGSTGRRRERSRPPRHSALMAYDSGPRQDRPLQRQHRAAGAATTAGTWVDETWEWDGTAGDVDAGSPRRAVTSTQYEQRLHQHGLRPGASTRSSSTTTGTTIWDVHRGRRRHGHLGRRRARCRRRSTPRCRATYNPGDGLRRRSAEAGGVRRPELQRRQLWELNTRRLHLDEPVRARERPDPAAVPVDGLRQQERQADGVRRPQLGRQPVQAGHLGVVGDRRRR